MGEMTLPDGSVMQNIPDDADSKIVNRQANKYLADKYGTNWFIGGHPAKTEMGPDGKPTSYAVYDVDNPAQLKVRVPATYNTPEIEDMLKKRHLNGIDVVKHRKENNYGISPEAVKQEESATIPSLVGESERKLLDQFHIQGNSRYKDGQEPTERLLAAAPQFLQEQGKFAMSIPALKTATEVANRVPGTPLIKAGVGALAGAGTYLAGRKILDSEDTPANALGDLALSEIPAIGLEKLMSGGRAAWLELSKPGSIVGERIKRVGLTYSQAKAYLAGKDPGAVKYLEDIFAGPQKVALQEQAAKNLQEAGLEQATKVAGTKVQDPHYLRQSTQLQLEDQAQALTDFSHSKAEEVKNLAKNSRANIPTLPVNPETGQFATKEVDGPIILQDSLERLKKYSDKYNDTSLIPPGEESLYAKAKNILNETKAKFNSNGDLVYHDPVSFEDAWAMKKDLGKLYSPKGSVIEPSEYAKTTFHNGNFNSFNTDIENSFSGPAWKNNGEQALEAFQQSKQAASQRYALFKDTTAGDIIKAGGDPKAVLDSVLRNPNKLQEVLNTNSIKLPDGTVKSQNMRRSILGEVFNRWFTEGANLNRYGKDSLSMAGIWKDIADPETQQSLKLLMNRGTKKEVEDFAGAIGESLELSKMAGYSQDPVLMKNSPYFKFIKPTAMGLSLAAPLLTGALSGSYLSTAGVAGFTLGGAALAHLMTGENSARVMVAIAKGKKLGSDSFMAHSLVNALKGTNTIIGIVDGEGKTTKATINKNGELEPVQ